MKIGREVDSPEDKLLHSRGTRVWHFANAVTRKAKQENPNCVIYGMAYQNFQAPPTAVKIEPDLNVFLAFNRRCWRHAIDDPGCLTNIVYNSRYKAWAAQKTPAICWEQVDHAGARFLPIEREVAHTLKYYKSLGNVNGSYPEVFAPGMKLNRQKYSKMSLEAWLGMWQAMYIFAAFQWDIDLDYEKTLEENNSLYYGYGWQCGMNEFRKLMEKTSIETPGCFGHGHSAPLGRLLSSPEVYHKLLGYLDAAEKAAVQDPDKRALMHVQRDREYFALTWEKALKEYQESYRELHLYRAEAQPLIDGILDDAVWKDADTLSNFRNIKSQAPIAQTIVKASYDDENLYIGIEALEPQMDDIVANIKTDDGEIWLDNAVEIFINVPMQEEQYYQIIVNALGTKYDHSVNGAATDLAFDMGKARAVKKYEDRWILECAIPFKTLGAIPRDGENWRLTFQRARILNNGVREISTPNGWRSHSVYSFLNTIFSGKRAVNIASGAEIVKAFWQNPSFDSVYIPKKPVPKWEVKDGIVPKNWILSGTTYKGITPKLEMAKDEIGNSYARIGNFSTIFQKWTGPRGKFTVRFRAKAPENWT